MGAPDAVQQLKSHNSQPQLKYQRLKTVIINSLLLTGPDDKTIQESFENIFQKILKERTIDSVGINQIGLLSIMTKELSTGRIIELDNLSSGEKILP